ncbi:hypothetical protein EDD98_2632 [Streptomyces sp. PanSC19]|nr:hypothetical protein EDD98_2632 [Streptomyces sp. PanSC19]
MTGPARRGRLRVPTSGGGSPARGAGSAPVVRSSTNPGPVTRGSFTGRQVSLPARPVVPRDGARGAHGPARPAAGESSSDHLVRGAVRRPGPPSEPGPAGRSEGADRTPAVPCSVGPRRRGARARQGREAVAAGLEGPAARRTRATRPRTRLGDLRCPQVVGRCRAGGRDDATATPRPGPAGRARNSGAVAPGRPVAVTVDEATGTPTGIAEEAGVGTVPAGASTTGGGHRSQARVRRTAVPGVTRPRN